MSAHPKLFTCSILTAVTVLIFMTIRRISSFIKKFVALAKYEMKNFLRIGFKWENISMIRVRNGLENSELFPQ